MKKQDLKLMAKYANLWLDEMIKILMKEDNVTHPYNISPASKWRLRAEFSRSFPRFDVSPNNTNDFIHYAFNIKGKPRISWKDINRLPSIHWAI